MKNLLLVMKYYIDNEEHPPFPKFDYQISALKSMGYNVYYLGIEKGTVYLCHEDKKEKVYKLKARNVPFISTIYIYDGLYCALKNIFKSKYEFDLIYMRSMPTTINYGRALKTIKKNNCKIVTEIPTYPINKETKTEKRYIRKLYFKVSQKYFKKKSEYIDLFTLIGEKGSEFEGRPAINIENGISLTRTTLRKPLNKNDEIHLLGLATVANWHGYDRIISGLHMYYESGGEEKVIFHIVGNDGDGALKHCENLVKNYKLERNVVFEGAKYKEELNYFFDKCQIAIGSIGLHRTGYDSVATLKVREYMARGIPYVLSTSDQSVDESLGFYLKVPSDDSCVDIREVINFAKQTQSNSLLPQKMRSYTSENMTWERQFEKVFSFLERL